MTQNEHFAKPIALPKWPIFKIVLFREYLVFFGAVFCTELLYCACRIDFRMFFFILIFDPNLAFCKAYSVGKMADFLKRALVCQFVCVKVSLDKKRKRSLGKNLRKTAKVRHV